MSDSYAAPAALPAAPFPPLFPALPVALTLCPAPEETGYVLRAAWAETIAGRPRRTRSHQRVGLRVAVHGEQLRLHLTAPPPRLHPPAADAFGQLGQHLAELYAELVIDAAPTGELLGLANAAAIATRWGQLKQELAWLYPAPSEMVAALVAGTDRQLARPESLGASLRFNYFYAALLGDFYQQPFVPGGQYRQEREYPAFFDGVALYFTQTLRLAPSTHPAHANLLLTGELNRAATDLGAVAARIQSALGTADPVDPAEIQATCRATHELVRATGLPAAVTLTVRCAYRDEYEKEYYLTIAPELPP